MNILLSVAAFLAFAIGCVHSYLGERYILMRLFRRSELGYQDSHRSGQK